MKIKYPNLLRESKKQAANALLLQKMEIELNRTPDPCQKEGKYISIGFKCGGVIICFLKNLDLQKYC